MTAVHRRVLALAGLLVALVHLASMPPTLEDLDSVNFALGVEAFDVGRHRPHPPGYPVYIAAAKAADAALAAWLPSWSRDRRAAASLALWSALASGLAVVIIAAYWRAIGAPPLAASLATALAVASPLFWLTASRPLSDMPGLVAALTVMTLLVRGLRTLRDAPQGPVPRVWWWAALGAGLVVGVRTQTLWLTGPLLCWCAGELAGRGRWRDASAVLVTAGVGVALWLLPLSWLAGGWSAYLSALSGQGAEDFIGVEMLATMPSWSLLAEALSRTLRGPWLEPALSLVVGVCAALGFARMLMRRQRLLALLLLSFWPYGVFHLTFQETETLRYALPLVVPVAGLAVLALSGLPRVMAVGATTVLVTAAIWTAHPPLSAYRVVGAPIFRAFADLEATVPPQVPAAVGMHRRIASEARQALVWAAGAWPLSFLPTERGAEVPAVVDYWRDGGQEPLWFLANPIRRDLSLIDRRARTLKAEYRWPAQTRTLVAIARPTDVDAWVITRPRWMLGAGWAVTPEVGGRSAALGLGPHRGAVEAYLRRDPAPLRVVIGGRHLGAPDDPPVTLVARIDGVEVSRWTVAVEPRHFQQRLQVPDGIPAGDTPYATLSVLADGGQPYTPPVGLEFFDAAPESDVMWTFGDGWHEPEQQPGTGLTWRWAGPQAVVRVSGPDAPYRLTWRGDAPRRYFGRSVAVRVRLGDVEIAQVTLDGEFSESVTLPAGALKTGEADVTFETDAAFVPADRGESPDRRRLSLRVYDVTLTPVR